MHSAQQSDSDRPRARQITQFPRAAPSSRSVPATVASSDLSAWLSFPSPIQQVICQTAAISDLQLLCVDRDISVRISDAKQRRAWCRIARWLDKITHATIFYCRNTGAAVTRPASRIDPDAVSLSQFQ